ncbi:CpsD/CapB family tyrosine-protein kinase [Priestia flexa]|uniref:CpsD/CapB family tyrosine-protein kinase n=1 Tax=Priestia flexa TaxID=86664 RepID=UPI00240D0373|nr:CpsD/CapB family tyrosine-protein kinase [Priestia flexa]WEZ07322.1 CpsD/CapB family tyrosine-protein kinase [Priestia flexa]
MLSKKRQSSAFKKQSLIAYSNPNSLISDQFRTIRTNIQFLMKEKKNYLLLITSAEQGTGKSMIAANLATSIAQKQRVLLIDANLRSPFIHTIFKLSNKVGLTDVLERTADLVEAIYQPAIGQLEILTSGKPSYNPAELLGSDTMIRLMQIIVNRYDVVIIDSPSVLDFTETRLMANRCHGVVLVLKQGKIKPQQLIEAKNILDLAHAKLVGTIINEK